MQWEREERLSSALWVAALGAGVDAVPTPAEVWEQFTTALAAPPTRRSRDEWALRRALGLVA